MGNNIGNIIVGWLFIFVGVAGTLGCSYVIVKMIHQIIKGHRGKLHYMCVIGYGLGLTSIFFAFKLMGNATIGLALLPSLFIQCILLGYVWKRVYKFEKNIFLYNMFKEIYWVGILGMVTIIVLIPLVLYHNFGK
jgi:hypothetical protein